MESIGKPAENIYLGQCPYILDTKKLGLSDGAKSEKWVMGMAVSFTDRSLLADCGPGHPRCQQPVRLPGRWHHRWCPRYFKQSIEDSIDSVLEYPHQSLAFWE